MYDHFSEMLRALQVLKRLHGLLKREDTIDVRVDLVEVGESQQLLKLLLGADYDTTSTTLGSRSREGKEARTVRMPA